MFFHHHFTNRKVRLQKLRALKLASGRAGHDPDVQKPKAPDDATPHSLPPASLKLHFLRWCEQEEPGSKTQTRQSCSHISSQSALISAASFAGIEPSGFLCQILLREQYHHPPLPLPHLPPAAPEVRGLINFGSCGRGRKGTYS